jgi:hypothetical protein
MRQSLVCIMILELLLTAIMKNRKNLHTQHTLLQINHFSSIDANESQDIAGEPDVLGRGKVLREREKAYHGQIPPNRIGFRNRTD